ncbi:MAG: GNAT family N-acetyltransferase [Pseudomonadota bacterium]
MGSVNSNSNDYVTRVFASPADIAASDWDALLARQPNASPFMRHAYLLALHASGSATPATGWTPAFVTLWRNNTLHAACALYLKDHSYGEYVFDWAWANAYEQHGLAYYPKAVAAVPFTPVPGARLLAMDASARQALVQALVGWCEENKLSSLHLLFANDEDVAACAAENLMLRHTVQFHWKNANYPDFDTFLATLSQDKRKKIRQERRKVADADVQFRWSLGQNIAAADWDFFYRCYERTYREHGNPPYLNRDFFQRMADTMTGHWLLFVAERNGQPIATSLIALSQDSTRGQGQFGLKNAAEVPCQVAYGRYWGALERVDCLHFEACYYQPLAWCIEHGVQRFEGGAQGEHKMARALMPVKTTSAHWLAHPAFADAVERFLEREGQGITHYLDHLGERSPFRQA